MITEEKLTLVNAHQTQQLGVRLARQLHRRTALIFLCGELGAGKTTLVQGMIKELTFSEAIFVPSPTYAYMREYRGHVPIYHFDLYRMENSESFFELGLAEQLTDQSALRLVEWPERLGEAEPDLHIELVYASHGRDAVIKYFSPFPIIP